MASFVLVHGSTQNATCWARVGGRLRARGHRVSTPELPKSAPSWGFEEYAGEIARAIETPEAVVVAHSISGAFLPSVPRVRPCAMLVFFAAAIPQSGKSARDQVADDPTMFPPEWIAAGTRWFKPDEHARLAREFLFHDCDAEALRWGLETIELMDARHLFTRVQPETTCPAVRTACMIAIRDRTISPDWSRRMARQVLGAEPIEMDAGHCPHVSQPGAVADILDQLTR